MGPCQLRGKRLERCSLGTGVCQQASAELLNVVVEARVVQQTVFEECSVELGAVPGPHNILSEFRKCRNTSSKGGGGASRGGHGVGARKNVCVCVCVCVLLLKSLNCT